MPTDPAITTFPDGWDSEACLVGGRWVERRPRRPEVAERLRTETWLMPWLAPQLPLPVPVPAVVADDPLVVRHVVVPGEPLGAPLAAHGRRLGAFLRALHAADTTEAVRRGVPARERTCHERADMVREFTSRVLPLLPAERRRPASALLAQVAALPARTLVHGDLGPEHVLARNGQLTGVIDFGDVHIGDPAIDLAWALHATPPAFADALATAYPVTPQLRQHALIWHQLGPWYEVTHGLDLDERDTVRSGLDGVLARLPASA
ncbi:MULTISPECIES: phosphotransferase [unclassified Streptomyces]|uniref:phosphotransferase n=1 Tax=unclassified Streptomyces TaxID=2593676 RepID=UPI000362605C|nr:MULTISPECIES: phosphotransferase [unclassified Streptomyces]MYT29923.1 phosphotransferase [Streptomyces sp. SID8354]